MDVHDLIKRAGGVTRMAAALGVSHTTVCDWQRTGFVPGGRAVQIAQTFTLPIAAVAALSRPRKSSPALTVQAALTGQARSRLRPRA